MFELTYLQCFISIILIWILTRTITWIKAKKAGEEITAKRIILRELQLLLVLICLLVIARIVYFPWHHVNGHIGTLTFDSSKILPLRINLKPIVRLTDVYDGWQMNIIGNITMFIPVGIIWPICFKKLDRLWKTLLAGAAYSLLIEISQLLFYQRSTDIDDLLLNSSGVLIGAIIYFGIRKIIQIIKR